MASPRTYRVVSPGVALGEASYEQGDTFSAELKPAEKWLLRDGHIAAADDPAGTEADAPASPEASGQIPADDPAEDEETD